MSTSAFYDELSRYYRQARALDSIIRSEGGPEPHTILDCSCGIGTQSLGLAARGYEVTASDLSPAAVERARLEARQRGLSLQVSVADMRSLYKHHGRTFDVVLSCDNSVPHLLSNEDILTAFRQFYECTRPGGICLVSVRDYAAMDFSSRTQLHPYGVRDVGDVRYVLFQVWDLKPPLYETTFYVIEHRGSSSVSMQLIPIGSGKQGVSEPFRFIGSRTPNCRVNGLCVSLGDAHGKQLSLLLHLSASAAPGRIS